MKKILFVLSAVLMSFGLLSCNNDDDKLEVRKIYVEPESLWLGVGHRQTVTPIALPDKITDAVFTWKSDDAGVASVDNEGNVTGVAVGKTVIYVTSGSITKDIPVTVYKPLTDILIEPETDELMLKIQNGVAVTAELKITPVPADAEEKIVCKVLDDNVASISAEGVVTPLAAGSTKLVIKGEGETISKEISITVSKSGKDAVKLDSKKFNFIYTVSGDNCQDMNEWWPMINIFDGNRETGGGTAPTAVVQSFTVDLGATMNIAYMHLFTWEGLYTDGPQFHPFGELNIRKMEVFGSNTLDESGDWETWTKLMDCEVIKPSGLPLGESDASDWTACKKGQMFFTDNYDLPVRYLRIRINEVWKGLEFHNWRCCEMEFYGNEAETE